MAWFGDGLSSLTNLKGQITNFTKEVLSEGIVDEIDERSKELKEVNEKCVQLQELLNSKDAEISLLRRQNCELQKAVVELNAKPQQTNDDVQDDEGGGGFFWDPPTVKNRDSKNQNQTRLLQDQLAQATVRIRELESELNKLQKVNASGLKDEITEGHQKTELLRAKQDMVNRIIQMGEKNREAERNMKRLQLDEVALVNDFRTIISQLGSPEQLDLIRGALKALETENEKYRVNQEIEKFDVEEKTKKLDEENFESVTLRSNVEGSLSSHKRDERSIKEDPSNREVELEKKVAELQEENRNLSASIEELDQQHGESIEKILAMKEEVQKKHQSLQKAYEQLYVDYNTAESKLEALKRKLSSSESNNNNTIKESTKSQCLQTESIDNEEKLVQTEEPGMNVEEKSDRIVELVQKVKEISRNYPVKVETNETIFEAIAREYIETRWKTNVLEKKLSEIGRELKETVDTKESLQVECDDMQANIESLLLEIQYLKSNLPSIPEASEERVAMLETEIESLHEVMSQLRKENAIAISRTISVASTDTSKNLEYLQAVVRDTEEQLKIVTNRLIGTSRCAENNEALARDLNRKLSLSLDEKIELREKIDQLQHSEKQMQEQLSMSLKRCKGLDDNIELIEELKLDLENARRELKNSIVNGKRLEGELANLQSAKGEIEKDVEVLSREKERLETELSLLRRVGTRNDDRELLDDLREQLDKANCDKNDLEYDILNMRKELDQALDQLDSEQFQSVKLGQENERLTKENGSLLEQLAATQTESLDKVELLSTEKILLEQEYAMLENEATISKAKLDEVANELRVTKGRLVDLENELSVSRLRAEERRSNDEDVRSKLEDRCRELEEKLRLLEPVEEKLRSTETRCEQLDSELTALRGVKEELSALRVERANLEERLKVAMSSEDKLRTIESKWCEVEAEVEYLRSEREKFVLLAEKRTRDDDEDRRILEALDEKSREIETLTIERDILTKTVAEEQLKLKSYVESNGDSVSMAKETIESLSQLVREKDDEIERTKLTVGSASAEFERELSLAKAERDELVRLVQVKHNESLQYHAEIQRLTELLNEQASSVQRLIVERDASKAIVKEKEAEMLWTQNELQVVRQKLRSFEESHDGEDEVCRIVEHSAQIAQAAILNEKCKALEAALIQEQSSNRIMQNQLTESQNKEANAGRELERLRTHLMEMEASYTEEALLVEESRKELEAKLLQAEEKAKNSSNVYTSASIRANQQVETLQQQMALIVQQRDDIQNKLSTAEDKVLAHAASLTNLQIVLEQFQRDKEKDILAATQKIRQQLNDSYKKQEELSNEISILKDQLTEAKECLKAASRLSEQLEKKTERIEQLTKEVTLLTELVDTADQKIREANKSGEGKVDKTLVKNLLLGYISSSTTDKSSVLRVFATVLDFNESERDKIGLNNLAANSGWFAGLLGSGGASSSKDQEASLSAAFVKFLESESKPKPQLPPLPILTTTMPRPSHSRQHSTSSTQSTLLLSNISLPTFPDFVPARNTGSILKEVLKDS